MSRIFDLVEERRIPVNGYGDFIIETSIIEIDYSRCFITSNAGDYYAFLEIENKDDLFGWNVTKVSLDDINDVNNGYKNIQSLFIDKPKYELLFKNSSTGVLSKVDDFKEKYSIKGNIFKRNFCDMDSLFDYHQFALEARQENSNKVSVVLQNKKGCVTELIYKIINYISSICKNLSHPLDIMNSDFSVMHSSTVITFTFNDHDGPLLQGENKMTPSSSEGISELGNMLSTSDTVSLLSEQNKKTEKVLKKYDNLIKTFEKTNDTKPKIVVASPDRSKPISYDMSKRGTKEKKVAISKALQYIKNNSKTIKEPVSCRGILTGILTSSGNFFSFLANNNTKYSGSVDFKMIGLEQFDVNGSIYDAEIEKITIVSETGDVIKESSKLVSLTFVKKIDKHSQLKIADF